MTLSHIGKLSWAPTNWSERVNSQLSNNARKEENRMWLIIIIFLRLESPSQFLLDLELPTTKNSSILRRSGTSVYFQRKNSIDDEFASLHKNPMNCELFFTPFQIDCSLELKREFQTFPTFVNPLNRSWILKPCQSFFMLFPRLAIIQTFPYCLQRGNNSPRTFFYHQIDVKLVWH